jgi:hypothetical protein
MVLQGTPLNSMFLLTKNCPLNSMLLEGLPLNSILPNELPLDSMLLEGIPLIFTWNYTEDETILIR